ncbi:hypothetical protein P153DRAFT_367207 [Dothidotthia symphoricarpi CBS 119687]|uniref:Uncharacterized protein n=1 Tax=Dothidotthia symphoricarpi CBS 119687 TaxID=1392245 RepID=A0A6A6AAU2_9PLEO|nr:uncharacterized protein P153DRAFT_367207 [Dothidotthia symphoricarpi CBS 119687]KAF2128889.1 hypothetical protein P153DRAFT_367207 [Dothidotthia symphoricarpi CBS 119687]
MDSVQGLDINKRAVIYVQQQQQQHRNASSSTTPAMPPRNALAVESLKSCGWAKHGSARDAAVALQIAARTSLVAEEEEEGFERGVGERSSSLSQLPPGARPASSYYLRGFGARVSDTTSSSRCSPVSYLDCEFVSSHYGPETKTIHVMPQGVHSKLIAGLTKPPSPLTKCYAPTPAGERVPTPSPVANTTSLRPHGAPQRYHPRTKTHTTPISEIVVGNTSHKRGIFESPPRLASAGAPYASNTLGNESVPMRKFTLTGNPRVCEPSVYEHKRTCSGTSSVDRTYVPHRRTESLCSVPPVVPCRSRERVVSESSCKQGQGRIISGQNVYDDQTSASSSKEDLLIMAPRGLETTSISTAVTHHTANNPYATTSPPAETQHSLHPGFVDVEPDPNPSPQPDPEPILHNYESFPVETHEVMLQNSQVFALTPIEARHFYPLGRFVQAGREYNVVVRDFAFPPGIAGTDSPPEEEEEEPEPESESLAADQEKHVHFASRSQHTPSMRYRWLSADLTGSPIDFGDFDAVEAKMEERRAAEEMRGGGVDGKVASWLRQTVYSPNTAAVMRRGPETNETNENGRTLPVLPATVYRLHPTVPSVSQEGRGNSLGKNTIRAIHPTTISKPPLPAKDVDSGRGSWDAGQDAQPPNFPTPPPELAETSGTPPQDTQHKPSFPLIRGAPHKIRNVFAARRGIANDEHVTTPPVQISRRRVSSAPILPSNPGDVEKQEEGRKGWPSLGRLARQVRRCMPLRKREREGVVG